MAYADGACRFIAVSEKANQVADMVINAGSLFITSKPKYVGKFPESAPPPEVKS
jgi:hypothetical protein